MLGVQAEGTSTVAVVTMCLFRVGVRLLGDRLHELVEISESLAHLEDLCLHAGTILVIFS